MNNLEIRQLTPGDAHVLKAMRLEALQLEPSSYASSFSDWAALSDDEWRDRLKMPVFAAFNTGQAVGIMGLMRQKATKMQHRASLVMVYLRADMRGSGAADNLLEAVAAFALQNGILQFELNVSCENERAIRFYEHSGFRKVGLIPAGMINEGEAVDEVIMVRRLR